MPRKPKSEKQKRTFHVKGEDIHVSFFPPKGRERSWQAYWKGLPTRKATKALTFEAAVATVQRILFGDEAHSIKNTLSDEEFDEVQKQHYARIQAKPETVVGCFEAIEAFRMITGVTPISQATADDCARFQDEALQLPKNWRAPFKDEARRQLRTKDAPLGKLSRQTILKWSTSLSAAFNRVNANAGTKCVRNVVQAEKLLLKNPWDEFTWIEDKSLAKVRQFTPDELLSILELFELSFPDMSVATAAVRLFLWSYARRLEIATLRWNDMKIVENEVHFDIVGKWRVRKWFRIPSRLYEDLIALRVEESPFVFAAYSDQVRNHHSKRALPSRGRNIRPDFIPENFGDWLYHKVSDWSKNQPNGNAFLHAFRKTGLQYAVDGEVTNRRVAADARVNVGVMTTHYTSEQERQLREKSNRTFERICRSLPEEVLIRYGYTPEKVDPLHRELSEAVQNKDWAKVNQISQALLQRDQAG